MNTIAVVLALAAGAVRAEPVSVRVGATLPLTAGEFKAGVRMRDALQLAVDEKMAEGGVVVGLQHLPVVLDVVDDKGDPKLAAKQVEKLAERGAKVLVSGYTTPVVDEAAAAAEKLKIPNIGLAAAASSFKRGHRYLFGAFAPIDQAANATLRWIEEKRRAGLLSTPLKVAVLYENTGHGKDYRTGVVDFAGRTAARRAAYQLVLDRGFDLNTKNFKPLLAEVAAARPDVVLVDAHYDDFVAMHREYVAEGLCHKVLSYGARGTEAEALAALPKGSTDYLLTASWWNPMLGAHGASEAFMKSFQARYHRVPDWAEAVAYETARALLEAVHKAGTLDPDKVRDALATLRMESILPSGSLSFPEEFGHQAQYLFAVQQNLPGASSPVIYPLIAATSEGVAANPKCNGIRAGEH
jgi:branched-chain amino acid transport system substrate-binding protein